MAIATTRSTVAQTLLRLAVGGLMLGHGLMRFGRLEQWAMVHPLGLDPWGVTIAAIEVAGAVAIAVGLWVRPVAGILGAIAALTLAHALLVKSFGGASWETSALYIVCFLWLALQGGGPWSLDGILRDRQGTTATGESGSGAIAKERLSQAIQANERPTDDPPPTP